MSDTKKPFQWNTISLDNELFANYRKMTDRSEIKITEEDVDCQSILVLWGDI